MSNYQYLFIYDDFDVPLDGAGVATCSTNPAHARPWLIQTMETAESIVDFLEGRSTIGQVNIQLLDKRLTANDQTTGWFTARLSDGTGENKLVGRRISLDVRDAGGTLLYSVFSGVINEIQLDSDDVTYTIICRDPRDNERAQSLFNVTNGVASVHPPGITNGYGTYINAGGGTQMMIPSADTTQVGTCRLHTSGTGATILLDKSAQSITDALYNRLYADINGSGSLYDSAGAFVGFIFPNAIVRWRDQATHGAWTTFRNMPEPQVPVVAAVIGAIWPPNVFSIAESKNQPDGSYLSSLNRVNIYQTAGSPALPAAGQRVEVQILSNLPPSETYPFWWEGNLGQLLKDIYDGIYCYNDPKIRYNAAAMAAFIAICPTARLRLTAPVEDLRPWVEENIYKPMGYAPSVNQAGEIVPVSLALPDVSVTLVNLDNSNCRSATWLHSSDDSVTRTSWKWKVDKLTRVIPTSLKPPTPTVDIVAEYDRNDVYLSASAAYVGIKNVDYAPVTLRDIDVATIGPQQADAHQTAAVSRLAQKTSRMLIDRLRFGGQHIMVKGAKRSDSNVQALKVGDWCVLGFANLPDYGTHKRGMSRLAQIIKIKDIDPLSRDMELLDSGPSGAPLSIPTIGTLTVSGNVISVPVTQAAAGEVAIEYALSAGVPTTGSPLWQRFARGPTGTYKLPPLPVNVIVWIRARSEGIGLRPSAWATAVSITIPDFAIPTNVMITIDVNNHAIITWLANASMLGARVYYAITPDQATVPIPLTLFNDVSAILGTVDLGLTHAGDTITVEVEGWTGWTGSAVSGVQGKKMSYQLVRPTAGGLVPLLCRAKILTTSAGNVVVRVAVADPLPGANITLAYVATGTGTITPASPQTILAVNVTSDIDTTGTVDFTIARAAFGTGTGRIVFTASRSERLGDTDSAEIPALDRDTLTLAMRIIRVSENATQIVANVEVISPIAGQTVTVVYDNGGLTITPASGGTLTSTVAFSSTGHIQYTITKDIHSGSPRRVTFTASVAGYVDATDGIDVNPDDNRFRCLLTNSAGQTIPNNTPTDLTFDTETFDVGPLHDTVTNNNRITIPTGGNNGVWFFQAQVRWAANITGSRNLNILKNGSIQLGISQVQNCGGDPVIQHVSYLDNAPAVGDYYTVTAYQVSGASIVVSATATWFAAIHLL